MLNSTCPYTCLERNSSNCGVQYSAGTQLAFCDIPHPSTFPAIVQVCAGAAYWSCVLVLCAGAVRWHPPTAEPKRHVSAALLSCSCTQTPRDEERAAIQRPKVTMLYTQGQNATLSDKLAQGLLPKPVLQASTLLAAQVYLEQHAQQIPGPSIPGEAFALLGLNRLGSSSVMQEAAGLYLEAAVAPVRLLQLTCCTSASDCVCWQPFGRQQAASTCAGPCTLRVRAPLVRNSLPCADARCAGA